MKKQDFYNQFKGSGVQVIDFKGSVKVPSKIGQKAEIIISTLAGASDGWDMTLAQLQDAVFQHRGAKADWTASGSFDARDLITPNDLKQAMLEVFFHKRDSKFWETSMLEVFACKNGEIVLRKVPFEEGFFTEKKPKEAKVKTASLLADLMRLAETKGDLYEEEELNALLEAIDKVTAMTAELLNIA